MHYEDYNTPYFNIMTQENIPEHYSQGLPIGTMLAEYRIDQLLGQGGFGITYLAYDTKLEKRVVLKENLPAGYASRQLGTSQVYPQGKAENFLWATNNFINEARTLSEHNHPSIIKVYRAFEANGTAYFVMNHIQGQSLEEAEDTQSWSEDQLRRILIEILEALDYLHAQNLLHRDIKPANIMLNEEGQPILIDFGTAKQMFSERSQTITESAGYTPVEQMRSRGKTGPWSDLYALGGTFHKLITGEKPIRSLDRLDDEGDPHTLLLLSKKSTTTLAPFARL